MENVRFASSTEMDNMLINQANCTLNPLSSELWHRSIVVFGDRTSASNTAITTLKQKGVRIVLNNTEL